MSYSGCCWFLWFCGPVPDCCCSIFDFCLNRRVKDPSAELNCLRQKRKGGDARKLRQTRRKVRRWYGFLQSHWGSLRKVVSTKAQSCRCCLRAVLYCQAEQKKQEYRSNESWTQSWLADRRRSGVSIPIDPRHTQTVWSWRSRSGFRGLHDEFGLLSESTFDVYVPGLEPEVPG